MIGSDRAAALIRSHFPDYHVESAEAMGHQGWGGDSDAFTVSGRDIFRFPRSLKVRRKLGIEVRLLPLLEPTLPLAIPHFMCVAADPDRGPPLFVGYPRIEGLQLTIERFALLDPTTRAVFARQIGAFIGALHRFPVSAARQAGVRFVADARADLAGYYARVQEQLFPLLSAAERAWVHQLFDPLLADPAGFRFAAVLCHKDLSGDHILYDPEALMLTGIIDFGDCDIMDPLIDFAGLANEYGERFCASALAAAGYRLDESARRRLLFFERRGPLVEMLYGIEEGHAAEVEEGLRRLRTLANPGSHDQRSDAC